MHYGWLFEYSIWILLTASQTIMLILNLHRFWPHLSPLSEFSLVSATASLWGIVTRNTQRPLFAHIPQATVAFIVFQGCACILHIVLSCDLFGVNFSRSDIYGCRWQTVFQWILNQLVC